MPSLHGSDERLNADPTNNRNHYYLSDVMGGNIGLYVVDDGDPGTDRVAVFQQFDAFGNDMTKPLSSTSSFAWRGREGSVTDRASGLIYMQARHYDPSIGRFIQADTIPLASLTTQGMNRYAYCENDPVNKSDPSGLLGGLFIIAVALIVFAFALAKLMKWIIYGNRLCNMPQARVNINQRTMGPEDEFRFAIEGLGGSLPPGTSVNPLPSTCTARPSAIANLINFLLGLL